MGVPKFFRWLSERYPKINQRFGSLPENDTCERYFGRPPPQPLEYPDPLSTCGLAPEVDRLYIDFNGIIHGCSHNNNLEDDESADADGAVESSTSGSAKISREEIFRNVCYYLDRLVGDIVQPNQLVYMAIDGVAPRAKLNQQRSRRYRSGMEGQIETNIYEAHAQKMAREEEQRLAEERSLLVGGRSDDDATPFSMDDGFSFVFGGGIDTENASTSASKGDKLQEVTPGRFKGKFEATAPSDSSSSTSHSKIGYDQADGENDVEPFHNNAITPGTPFFQEFTRHLEHFVKYKVSTDPKWQKLTIIFSGPNVPGEGEHKIMDFIRAEKRRPDYNPNLRHCIMGQDGDLIMLGLATHEPNLVLLRERVIFNMTKKRVTTAHFAGSNSTKNDNNISDTNGNSGSGLDSYLHNAHFEFLHMGVLRDYLAFEFETANVLSTSPYDLERTIDDFVFMTFFVGNDFLPHMPALDIADHAFDLLFHTYKECRAKWLQEDQEKGVQAMPYLTNAGNIVSGRRLEEFLAAVGNHEVTYYDKKKQAAPGEHKRIQRVAKKFGLDSHVPDARLVARKEESDRAAYREMIIREQMQLAQSNGVSVRGGGDDSSTKGIQDNESGDTMRFDIRDSFSPVMTGEFQPNDDSKESEEGLISRLGNLLQNSLSGEQEDDSLPGSWKAAGLNDQDLKGRYYYDKFQFTPFDEEKHLALRKAYIEGLVWNLKYYYEGCVSWEWYFPYHYGPMLSDLVNLDEILQDVSFEGRLGAPLRPFEQLMGCMPPSQAHNLPKPYRRFMTDPDSPIIDFYPESFTVDLNGKRWPWEAVTLLPFIDSRRLLEVAATVDESELTEEERARNSLGEAVVFEYDPSHVESLAGIGDSEGLVGLENCTAKAIPLSASSVNFQPHDKPVLEPKLLPGVTIPLPGYGSLRLAPVQTLWRRKLGIDVFSSRSRYKTSCLAMANMMPPLPPIEDLAPKLIGSSVFINYPYFLEGFVTSVSNETTTIRGQNEPRYWSDKEAAAWRNRKEAISRQFLTGEGLSGTGGLMIPEDQPISLTVRPFEKIARTKDGTAVKSYAKFEVEVPLVSTFWNPTLPDPRLNLPSRLEKNRFEVAMSTGKKNHSSKGHQPQQHSLPKRLFPPKKSHPVKIQSASFSHWSIPENIHERENSGHPTTIELHSLGALGKKRHIIHKKHIPLQNPLGLQPVVNQGKNKVLTSLARSGASPRGRFFTVGLAVASFLVGGVESVSNTGSRRPTQPFLENFEANSHHLYCSNGIFFDSPGLSPLRGGDFEEAVDDQSTTPGLQFAHGTTTLSFVFQGGIIAAVDSRASLGSFVGSKTTQKVLPVNSHILGTMAGGAADCMHWIRKLKSRALLHELSEGCRMTVARASRILSNSLYEYQGKDLSIGTMIMGYDEGGGPPRIFYVDNTGKRIEGEMFAVGSGSTFALGILDTELRQNMTVDEAIALGIKAIRHATFRDAYSGGFINVYLITNEGWKKVYTEDIARLSS